MTKHFYTPKCCSVATKLRPLSVALALLGVSTIASAQEFNQTLFFGDSLTDSGRLAQIGKNSLAAPLFQDAQAAFTTNPDPAWAGVLADAYGHKADPNDGKTLTGTNYAVGGARTATEVDRLVFKIPSTQTQIKNYLALTNNQADPSALYTVWTGANDLFAATEAPNPEQALGIITTAAAHQAALVKQLGQAGAKYVLVPNIPDVGLTPGFVSDPAKSSSATLAANIYNQTLYQALNDQSVNVIAANTFGLLQEATQNPTAFGFKNVTEPACQNLDPNLSSLGCKVSDWQATAADANETYAFADGIHPSGRTHRILAQYYRSLIDSPVQMGQLLKLIIQQGNQNTQQLSRRLNGLSSDQSSVWIDGAISNHQLDEQNKSDQPNVMLGFDIANQNRHSGAYLTYQKQDHTLSDTINTDVKQVGVGLYHRHDLDRLRITGNIGLDRLSVDSDRRIAWDGESRNHQAQATGKRIYVGLQGSYDFIQGSVTYRPYLGIRAQEVKLNTLIENQPTLSTALSYELPKQQSIQGDIGIMVDYAMNDKVKVLAGLAYQHEFKDGDKTVHSTILSNQSYHQSYAMPVSFDQQNSTHAHLGATVKLGKTNLTTGINATHQDGDTNVGGFVGAQMAF
ncbi:autotransporter domain-containing protein [Moraxella canis]|uniref:Autotransporter domain-containing protein n=1 Tax=Moraxella canis TaxID=90239 RepID=A0ABZ0WWV8_9GAMM|nr:autotransporter domain-containing protein [Moraxella canis]WQE03518.1 autotransporter domain-containing protein [Moraxella canis]